MVLTSTAITVTESTTLIDATSGAAPVTLADGADGQVKIIINKSTGGSNAVTITPASFVAGTTINIDAPVEVLFVCLKIVNGM